MKPIIEIAHLSKRFGDLEAVRDLSFTVREGELFAFLGVNGAGKSTTISILCGRLRQDAGEVRIGGRQLEREGAAIKARLGVVFQNSALDKALTVLDNLRSRAALYGITGEAFRKRLEALDEISPCACEPSISPSTGTAFRQREAAAKRRRCPLRFPLREIVSVKTTAQQRESSRTFPIRFEKSPGVFLFPSSRKAKGPLSFRVRKLDTNQLAQSAQSAHRF